MELTRAQIENLAEDLEQTSEAIAATYTGAVNDSRTLSLLRQAINYLLNAVSILAEQVPEYKEFKK